jgi:hypothetical protein
MEWDGWDGMGWDGTERLIMLEHFVDAGDSKFSHLLGPQSHLIVPISLDWSRIPPIGIFHLRRVGLTGITNLKFYAERLSGEEVAMSCGYPPRYMR